MLVVNKKTVKIKKKDNAGSTQSHTEIDTSQYVQYVCIVSYLPSSILPHESIIPSK